jgi:hypothetical protein
MASKITTDKLGIERISWSPETGPFAGRTLRDGVPKRNQEHGLHVVFDQHDVIARTADKPDLAAVASELLDRKEARTKPAGTVYECLECGYTTTKRHLIDASGMGCVRCNH